MRSPRRALQALVLGCLFPLLLGANDSAHRFNKMGHEMICTCSCGQILLECNHVGCPVSPQMIDELRTQIATGGGDTSVLNWFAAKYGAIVLAAPIRGGFDNVAWIAPLAVFFLATIGTAVVVRVWSSRTIPAGAAIHNPEADALRARIRRETEF